MSKTKKRKKTEEVELSYQEALSITNAINPQKQSNGRLVRTQSDLSKAKGRTAIQVYFMKHSIKEAFAPYDDMITTQKELAQPLFEELRDLKDKKRKEEIESEIEKIQNEIESINEKTETVSLPKGRLKLSEIEHLVSADELVALEPVIDFEG